MRARDFILEANQLTIPKGSKGTDVENLQNALLNLGYKLPRHGADGIYGPETKQAVTDFQKDYGIKVDGVAGAETIGALNKTLDVGAAKWFKKVGVDAYTDKIKNLQKLDPNAPLDMTPTIHKSKSQADVVKAVLDFISKYESTKGAGYYDSVYPGSRRPEILNMTINELLADMKQRVNQQVKAKKEKGAKRATGSSASGRYQYIAPTLELVGKWAGLDFDKDVFDEKTQDKIATVDLIRRGKLKDWLAGKISDAEFLKNISNIWASLPDPGTGKSVYAGDAIGNKAGLSLKNALTSIAAAKGGLELG